MKDRADVVSTLVSLLSREVTFAMYSLPGSDYVEVLIDDNESPVISERKFTITLWNGAKYVILDRRYSQCMADVQVEGSFTGIQTHGYESTSWPEYKSGIDRAIEVLGRNGGKVVISKQEILIDYRLDYRALSRCVYEMFSYYKNAFCAVYYTPATGAWCSCSPELLLSVDKKSGELHTVALAGTRNIADDGPWDNKNIKEHAYVVKYINDALTSAGIKVHVFDTEPMPAGNIQHLLTRIDGQINTSHTDSDIDRIISKLHPTPAICGYPVEWSRNMIEAIERHERECYGGYYSVEDSDRFIAHVNLRCFAFSSGICRFFAGGGILADSTPECEWNEATSKINVTRSFIEKALTGL